MTKDWINAHVGTLCLQLDESGIPISHQQFNDLFSTVFQFSETVNKFRKCARNDERISATNKIDCMGFYLTGRLKFILNSNREVWNSHLGPSLGKKQPRKLKDFRGPLELMKP
jgi:hypothetical protein